MATLKEDALIVAGIGLAVIAIAWYLKTKVGEAIDAAPDAIANAAGDAWDAAVKASRYVNPFSQDNLANQGANSAYQWATGSTGSIGTDLYDLVNEQIRFAPVNVPNTPGYDPWKEATDASGKVITFNSQRNPMAGGYHGGM